MSARVGLDLGSNPNLTREGYSKEPRREVPLWGVKSELGAWCSGLGWAVACLLTVVWIVRGDNLTFGECFISNKQRAIWCNGTSFSREWEDDGFYAPIICEGCRRPRSNVFKEDWDGSPCPGFDGGPGDPPECGFHEELKEICVPCDTPSPSPSPTVERSRECRESPPTPAPSEEDRDQPRGLTTSSFWEVGEARAPRPEDGWWSPQAL
jgi:hypothetical protein